MLSKFKKYDISVVLSLLLFIPTIVTATNITQDHDVKTKDEIVITGTVVDQMGNKMKGVAIESIDHDSLYTLTDRDGNFKIKAIRGSQIRISYIGYQSDSIPVTESQNILVKLYTKDDLKPVNKQKTSKKNWIIGAGAGVGF